MLTSLFTAVSGMNSNGTSLSVIGDNIANMNTIGFKASRVAFGDVLSQSIAGNSQVGRGSLVSEIAPLHTQGSLETTSSTLDMAIDGDGFFIVNDGGANYYTRAGQFSLDKNGKVVNADGLILQGYLADSAGNITGTVGDVVLGSTQSLANSSTNANISLNLDSQATVTPAFALVGNNPTNYNSSTTMTVYDSQGNAHQVTAYFTKTAANTWTANYVVKNSLDNLVNVGSQSLTFDTSGTLINDNSATAINFNWNTYYPANNVVDPQAITFNYGTGTGEGGTGLDASTQFASPFAITNITQDGYPSGALRSISISSDGTITGIFTNGQTRSVGKVALAKFVSTPNLTKSGRNLFAESFESGQPIVGSAQTSGLGRILSNSLELSNVDLAQEFVSLISAQRGFEANARIITTTDTLMSELVNLKR